LTSEVGIAARGRQRARARDHRRGSVGAPRDGSFTNAQRRTAQFDSFPGRITDETKVRLKVYVGAGVGVGKTYHMLEQAHQLHSDGYDVVLGFVETRGRPGTVALIHDLEIIPLREIS
jgi:K+-sensing histidine kinase KdpD